MPRASSSPALSYLPGNNAWLTNNYPTPDNTQSPPANNSSQPTSPQNNVSNSQQNNPRIMTRDSSFLSDLPSGGFFSEEPLLGSTTSIPPFPHDLSDTFPNTPPDVQTTSAPGSGLLNVDDRLIMNPDSHVDQLNMPTTGLVEADWNLLSSQYHENDYFHILDNTHLNDLSISSHIGYDNVLYNVGQNNDSLFFEKSILNSDVENSKYNNIGFSESYEDEPIFVNQVSDSLRRQSNYFQNMSTMFSTMEFAKVDPQSDDDITIPPTTVSETKRNMRPSGKRSKKRRRKYPLRSRSHSATENEADVDDISNSNSGHGRQLESDEFTHELSPVQSDREESLESISSIAEDVTNYSQNTQTSSIKHNLRSRKPVSYTKYSGAKSAASTRAKRIKTSPKISSQKVSSNNNVKSTPRRKYNRRKPTKSSKLVKSTKPSKLVKSTKPTKNTNPTYN
ncbi:8976_t:CDS:2, partial [Scutellospora calospora]